MMGISRIRRAIWRFRVQEAASVSVEVVLMAPIMVWAFLSTLQFFDAYRAELISTKGALTIADMFSRETGYIDDTYMDGTLSLLKYLTLAESSPDMRVTLFYYTKTGKKYNAAWSEVRGSVEILETADFPTMKDRLPVLSDGERAILVETWTDYQPKYGDGIGYMRGTGLDPIRFSTSVVISPRFATTVCWNNTPSDVSQEKC